MTNNELRALIPKSGDPDKPFLTKRHEEIDSLLCKHSFTQYELDLLKQDILMTTRIYEQKKTFRNNKVTKNVPDWYKKGTENG